MFTYNNYYLCSPHIFLGQKSCQVFSRLSSLHLARNLSYIIFQEFHLHILIKERKGGVVGIYQLTNLCVILMCDSCNTVFVLADLFPCGTLLPVSTRLGYSHARMDTGAAYKNGGLWGSSTVLHCHLNITIW